MKVFVVRELLRDHVLIIHHSRFQHVVTDADRLLNWVQEQVNLRGTNFSIDVWNIEYEESPQFFILVTKDMAPTESPFDPSTATCIRHDNGKGEPW